MLCPVLVGRSGELVSLRTALDEACGGRGRMVLVSGPAGVGKSRLLRAVVSCAREAGVMVLAGRAVDTVNPDPYRPVREAVVAALRGAVVLDAPELVPFRASLGRLVPHWQMPQADPASGSPVFVGEGLLILIRVLAGGGGALLVLEDLHWADSETMDLIEYVADGIGDQPLVCVASARPSALGDRLRAAATRGGGLVLDLAPLGSSDCADVARACLGVGELPAGLSELVGRSDGLPLLVEELLAAAVQSGALAREPEGRWSYHLGSVPAVPATVAEVVERRLAALHPTDRAAVHAAALLGRRFDWSVLSVALGRPAAEVLASLRRAADAQLVEVEDDEFRFRHALTVDAVLAQLVAEERRSMAVTLLAALPPDSAGPVEPRATLQEIVGDQAGAVQLLVTAAAESIAAGALDSARGLLLRAQRLTIDDPMQAQVVQELLLDVAAHAGDADTAFAIGIRLLGLGVAEPRRTRVHVRLAEAALAAGRWGDAETQARAAAQGVAELHDRAMAVAAQVALERGQLDTAVALATEVADSADPVAACEALEVLGRSARQRDIHVAKGVFERQLKRAMASRSTAWQVRAAHQLGSVEAMATLDVAGLRRARGQALAVGALARVATIDLQIATNQTFTFHMAECFDSVRSCADAARRLRLAVFADALLLQAHAHGVAGRRDLMERELAEAEALGIDDDQRCGMQARRGVLALLDEDREHALVLFEPAMASVRDRPLAVLRPAFALWPVLRAAAGHSNTEAVALLEERSAGVHAVTCGVGAAQAILLGRAGDGVGAQQAMDQVDQLMLVYEGRFAGYHHLIRRIVAETAIADGWGTPVPWLLEASDHFRETGHRLIEAACRSMLRSTGAPVPRRYHGHTRVPPDLHLLGVTDREVEVLALIADGLTNREVAERLFISTRTVDKHVERLKHKTGARSRIDLAARAKRLDT